VWERVRRYELRYRGNATHSLLEATDRVERAAATLIAGLSPLPFQTGVLIGIGGQPLVLEAYDSPQTLAHVWDDLLRAAAVDAVHARAVPTPGRRARRFVQRMTEVPLAPISGGIGSCGRGTTPYVRMSVLAWRGRAVHTVAINQRHELVAA
jgi:hypothetical protein